MGILVWLLLACVEVVLAVWTIRRAKGKEEWRRNRLIGRGVQAAVVFLVILLPVGQKWRFRPVFLVVLLLLVLAGIVWAVRRKQGGGERKTAGAVVSCVANVLLFLFLLVPAFLFTGYEGLPVTGGYTVARASVILVDPSRTDPYETDGSSREVPVHFYYPAVPEGEAAEFPLVVFSHGAFGYYQSNFSTYEELASHGYVVAALEHPHQSLFTHDTDGKLIPVDPAFLQSVLEAENSGEDNEEVIRAVEEEWMRLRAPDMSFAITAIEEAKGAGAPTQAWALMGTEEAEVQQILSLTDTGRIGVMGHSMGGATSVEMGRERDDIGAVIDIDGTMFGEYVRSETGSYQIREDPYGVPVLEFINWSQYGHLQDFLSQGGSYANDVMMKNAEEGFAVVVRDTEHLDFTDLPLLSPFFGDMLGSGARDTKEVMTIVNGLVLDFYDCYLKGEGTFHAQEIY